MSRTKDTILRRLREGDDRNNLYQLFDAHEMATRRYFHKIMDLVLEGRLTPFVDAKVGEKSKIEDVAREAMRVAEEISDVVGDRMLQAEDMLRALGRIDSR